MGIYNYYPLSYMGIYNYSTCNECFGT
jgi:hypothetical protein